MQSTNLHFLLNKTVDSTAKIIPNLQPKVNESLVSASVQEFNRKWNTHVHGERLIQSTLTENGI